MKRKQLKNNCFRFINKNTRIDTIILLTIIITNSIIMTYNTCINNKYNLNFTDKVVSIYILI